MEGLGEKVAEFEDSEGGTVYWVSVSEISGASSPGLFGIKDW